MCRKVVVKHSINPNHPHQSSSSTKFSQEWKICMSHDFTCILCQTSQLLVIISPNEVFGDIMVLASPPRPCPPVDPDDMTTLNLILSENWSNCIRSQTTLVFPKSSKCKNISISNGPIAFKFDTEVKYLKLHENNYQ